jgi:hypothetical protein
MVPVRLVATTVLRKVVIYVVMFPVARRATCRRGAFKVSAALTMVRRRRPSLDRQALFLADGCRGRHGRPLKTFNARMTRAWPKSMGRVARSAPSHFVNDHCDRVPGP